MGSEEEEAPMEDALKKYKANCLRTSGGSRKGKVGGGEGGEGGNPPGLMRRLGLAIENC